MVRPWPSPAPNHGFHLRAGGEVVGAVLAFYSERDLPGSTRLMCNLGAWCVSNEHRAQGVRLVVVTTSGIEDRVASLDASSPLFCELSELDPLGVVGLAEASHGDSAQWSGGFP